MPPTRDKPDESCRGHCGGAAVRSAEHVAGQYTNGHVRRLIPVIVNWRQEEHEGRVVVVVVV